MEKFFEYIDEETQKENYDHVLGKYFFFSACCGTITLQDYVKKVVLPCRSISLL